MKLRSKAKTGSYPDINEGDKVRTQMIHKTPKGVTSLLNLSYYCPGKKVVENLTQNPKT